MNALADFLWMGVTWALGGIALGLLVVAVVVACFAVVALHDWIGRRWPLPSPRSIGRANLDRLRREPLHTDDEMWDMRWQAVAAQATRQGMVDLARERAAEWDRPAWRRDDDEEAAA